MRLPRAIALAILAAALALSQTKQAMDEEYARLVKEWTTAPEFMSPLVDHLPKAPGVPTTKDVLGYYAGAPKKLTRVADLGKYYRALAAASKRVKLLTIGATDEGPLSGAAQNDHAQALFPSQHLHRRDQRRSNRTRQRVELIGVVDRHGFDTTRIHSHVHPNSFCHDALPQICLAEGSSRFRD